MPGSVVVQAPAPQYFSYGLPGAHHFCQSSMFRMVTVGGGGVGLIVATVAVLVGRGVVGRVDVDALVGVGLVALITGLASVRRGVLVAAGLIGLGAGVLVVSVGLAVGVVELGVSLVDVVLVMACASLPSPVFITAMIQPAATRVSPTVNAVLTTALRSAPPYSPTGPRTGLPSPSTQNSQSGGAGGQLGCGCQPLGGSQFRRGGTGQSGGTLKTFNVTLLTTCQPATAHKVT